MESGAGPLLVLVHGAGGNHTSWRFQARWLARHGYRVNALDLPGRVGDQHPPLSSVEAIAGWVADRVKERAVVIGHSLGGLVGLELAATKPELVAGLVTIGSALNVPVHPDLARAAQDREFKAVATIIGWSFDFRGQLGGQHDHLGIGPSLIAARTLESELGALGTDLQATAAYDGSRAAALVSVPVLVIGGTRDRMVSRAAVNQLSDALDRSRTAWLDCGHMVMSEAPDQLRLELSRYLDERRAEVGDW